MVQASVGFHCPDCVGRAAKASPVVEPSWRRSADPIATKVLIGLNVAVFVLSAAGAGSGAASGLMGGVSGSVYEQGVLFGPLVDQGEWWRIVTSGFLHGGLLHLGFNMYVLWILGSMLEPALGRGRYLALYFVSMLAGSLGVLLVSPQAATVGASGAIFGLMGAAVALQRDRGIDPWRSGLLTLVGLNLLITFAVPGISVGGHVGGLVGGALAGLVAFWLERQRVSTVATLAVLAVLGVGFSVAAVWAAGTWTDPLLGMLPVPG